MCCNLNKLQTDLKVSGELAKHNVSMKTKDESHLKQRMQSKALERLANKAKKKCLLYRSDYLSIVAVMALCLIYVLEYMTAMD